MLVIKWCVGMALTVGAGGFLAGYIGPILLSPPAGVVVGALAGLVIGLARRPTGAAAPTSQGGD